MPDGSGNITVNLGVIGIAWHMSPDNAANHLVGKNEFTDGDLAFKSLSRAFTVTGFDTQSGVADALKDLVDQALRDGKSINDVLRDNKDVDGIAKYIEAKGKARLISLVRHQMQEAYNAGRYYQQKQNMANRPFYRLNAVLDKRTSDVCSNANGHIYRFDTPGDPYPPLHYGGCRTIATALTEAQAGRLTSSDSPLNIPDGFGVRPDQKGEFRGSILALQSAIDLKQAQGPMQNQIKAGRPTKEEVGKLDFSWVFDSVDNAWYVRFGLGARNLPDARTTHWLPYDALPLPPGLQINPDDLPLSDDEDPDDNR